MHTLAADGVIDLDGSAFREVGGSTSDKKEMSLFLILWMWLRRKVRRSMMFLRRQWLRLPRGMRFVIRYAAEFTGWFVAWFIFYVSLIIAFSYSILLGFGVIFIYGCLIAAYIEHHTI